MFSKVKILKLTYKYLLQTSVSEKKLRLFDCTWTPETGCWPWQWWWDFNVKLSFMSRLFELLTAEEILVCTDNGFIFNLFVFNPTHLQLHPDIQRSRTIFLLFSICIISNISESHIDKIFSVSLCWLCEHVWLCQVIK